MRDGHSIQIFSLLIMQLLQNVCGANLGNVQVWRTKGEKEKEKKGKGNVRRWVGWSEMGAGNRVCISPFYAQMHVPGG